VKHNTIDVRNLTKIFGEGRTAVKALDSVERAIERGEFVALMGPSGSGESTLLNIVGGLDWATTGEVYVDGVEVTALQESQL
jgi:putative ABC transport system ATP-binding protein